MSERRPRKVKKNWPLNKWELTGDTGGGGGGERGGEIHSRVYLETSSPATRKEELSVLN